METDEGDMLDWLNVDVIEGQRKEDDQQQAKIGRRLSDNYLNL